MDQTEQKFILPLLDKDPDLKGIMRSTWNWKINS